jgi:hypothetical protein
LSQPVSAGDEPVADERLDLFLMIAGGGVAATLLLWLVVWSKMRNDKQAFEEQVSADSFGSGEGYGEPAHAAA